MWPTVLRKPRTKWGELQVFPTWCVRRTVNPDPVCPCLSLILVLSRCESCSWGCKVCAVSAGSLPRPFDVPSRYATTPTLRAWTFWRTPTTSTAWWRTSGTSWTSSKTLWTDSAKNCRACKEVLTVKPLTAEHGFYASASALNLLLLQQSRHLLLRGEGPPETFARTHLLFVGWAVKMRHVCRDNLFVIMWICVMIYKIHIIECESSAVIWSWFCLCCCSVPAAFNATQHLCPLDQLHTPTRGLTTTFKATKCCWMCKEQHLVVHASHQQRAPLSHPTSIHSRVPAAP